ncbi:MAG: PRC-barrel domain-containing protein [Candidatus Micrarchaeota archaeon]|jgi:sporulation protein YlmC with PRC-barrel domain
MMLSEIYGKKIITSGGKILGDVKEIVLDVENGQVSHLLTTKLEQLAKSSNVREALSKNSILYKRVKNVAESIVVSEK